MSQLTGVKQNLQASIFKYDEVIPSTGEKIKIKPFRVADEKVLLLAAQSKDVKQMTEAVKDIIDNCIERNSTHDLAYFDFEYLFVKIRAVSIGEISTFGYKCTKCGDIHDVTVDLSKVKIVKNEEHEKNIKISNNLMFAMRYPSIDDIFKTSDQSYEGVLNLLVECVEKVFSNEDVIEITEAEKLDLKEIVESLTAAQFEGLSDFLDTMPKLKEETGFTCEGCGTENIVILEGIRSFF